jgi:hypothetical protein
MSIFDRVANPFCPQGTADQTNALFPTIDPGTIGNQFFDQNTGNVYLRVFLDSGATTATATGAVKANQLAIWKDEVNKIVTNDPNFNDTGTPANFVNRIAGIFRTTVTAAPGVNNSQGQPAQYVCDILVNGKNVPILAVAGVLPAPGLGVIADTVANVQAGGGVKTLATATTAPTQQLLGISKSSGVSQPPPGTMLVDVNIGFID